MQKLKEIRADEIKLDRMAKAIKIEPHTLAYVIDHPRLLDLQTATKIARYLTLSLDELSEQIYGGAKC